MIDEKKLIEEIKSLQVTVNGLRAGKGILREFEKQYRESILSIIEEQPKVGEWIPCSERFPPKLEENHGIDKKPVYLVSVNGEDYPHRALWNGRCFTDGFLILEAVAWMPLPEPYKGE